MEELTKQQRRLAEAVRYRGNVPDYFRRKKPPRQVGKNASLAAPPVLPPEPSSLDDPALELIQRGLITIRTVRQRSVERQPMNSPARGLDADLLRDLEHIHLNVIEGVAGERQDSDLYPAALKSREILEAADAQLRRLRRVRLEDQKARARRRLQQLRQEARLRVGPVPGGGWDEGVDGAESRAEMRVHGRVFEAGGGGGRGGGTSRAMLETAGEAIDDVYYINEAAFEDDGFFMDGSDIGGRSPEFRPSRADGANLRYTHDSRASALPADDVVERLLASRSPSAAFFASLQGPREASWCVCRHPSGKEQKDTCGVCGEVGRHAAWCQHATSRRCEGCGKYHRRGSLSREVTRISQRSDRTLSRSLSSEETVLGPDGVVVRRRRHRRTRRRRGVVDDESEDEEVDVEMQREHRRAMRQAAAELISGNNSLDTNRMGSGWSGESIPSDEEYEIDPETGYPRRPRLKTRRHRPKLKEGQKRETNSAVYQGVRVPQKEQYRTAHLQAIASNRTKQLARAVGQQYPADYIFGLRTSRPTFSYFSMLPHYSRGLDFFNINESVISKFPRFIDLVSAKGKGKKGKTKKLTPMKLTYGDENPDNFIPRPLVLTIRKPKLSDSFYRSFKGL